jgi:anti-anti-sigma factor
MGFDPGDGNDLRIYLEVRQDSATINVEGDLDCYTANDLRRAFDQVEPFAAQCVNLDLHKLAFIDSRGIQMLVEARERAQGAGYNIRLVGPLTPIVQRIMDIAGLEHELRKQHGSV